MPAASAERPRPRSVRWAVAALIVVALTGCGRSVDVGELGHSSSDPAAVDQARGQHALDVFATALTNGDASATTTDATRAAVANAHTLGVTGVSFRYVTGVTPSTDDRQRYGAQAFAARVQATYRLAADPSPTSMEVGVVFAPTNGGANVAAVGGYDTRSALWLDGPAAIQTSGRLTVIDARPDTLARFVSFGQGALTAVAQVLPTWQGSLVIEVPTDAKQLASLTQSSASSGGDVAAVTTSVDGTLNQNSPLHVFLNRDVFSTMTDLGAQVVMSHEATHVATLGPLIAMPTWMLEGFADYVALAHAGVPLDKAAGQELARMKKQGIPDHLPTSQELAPSANGLGATYEEAWLAWHFMAATYGEPKAVAFYQAVSQGRGVDAAFTSVLKVTQAQFVQAWRTDLKMLIG